MERLKVVGQWYQTQTLSPRDYPNMLVSSEEWSVKVPKDNFLKNYFHTFFVEQRGLVDVLVYGCCCCWRDCFSFFSSLRTRRARGTHAANRPMDELKRSAWSSSDDFHPPPLTFFGAAVPWVSKHADGLRLWEIHFQSPYRVFANFCVVLNGFTINKKKKTLRSLRAIIKRKSKKKSRSISILEKSGSHAEVCCNN